MNKRVYSFVLCLLLCAIGPNANGKELVRKFTGDRSAETAEFEVEAPWLLDWRLNGEYPKSVGIEVSLIEANTGRHAGYVLKTKYPGNGVRLFNEGGRYRFKVDSTLANWILKVEQLSREEAALYSPVDQDQP
jgi:hypothetical protein